jgi:hypothetical protein
MTKKSAALRRKTTQPIRYTERSEFYESVAAVFRTAQSNTYRAVNFVMVEAYWNVGRMIVEEEQQGKGRAGYGKALIQNLSEQLTVDFGKGFNVSNLWAFKQFYTAFPILRTLCGESPAIETTGKTAGAVVPASAIPSAPRRELTWSHYRLLIRVEKPEARAWYMKEAAEQNWSVRA